MKKSLSSLLLLILIAGTSPAQTGKPQYLIRTERADTTLGFIKIELFPIITPLHAAYFDSLVSIQFYDSTAFHRVIPDFVIQGGDPNSRHGPRDTWGMGDSTQQNIPAEFTGVAHKRGIIGAARDEDINSANSQFFVNVADNLFLNYNYTAYGKVVEGMDVVDLIVNAPRDENDNPYEKISMFITKLDTNFAAPDNPEPLSPGSGAEGSTGFQKIEWSEVNDAVLYDVVIAEDSNFTNIFYKDSVGSTSFTVTDLQLGQKAYYWKIRANNGGFKSGFSETRYFVTSIDKPAHLLPENNATDVSLSPQLVWSKLKGAAYYKAQVAAVPTFSASAIVFDSTGITDTTVTLRNLESNKKYYWIIQGFTDTYAGPRSIVWSFTTQLINSNDDEYDIPTVFSLSQNYPNPFNPTTTIKYSIPSVETQNLASQPLVRLIIYDILGREIATLVNENKKPGYYEVEFDASGFSSGIYYYRIQAGDFVAVKKMILLK